MAQDTEVISCPACNHLVRVPIDWLGQSVQCPECKAMFKAPVKMGDSLTAPELLSRPAPVATPVARKKWDAMLMLPAFGLLLCGAMGAVVNGVFVWTIQTAPDGGHAWAKQQVEAKYRWVGDDGPPETQGQRLEEAAAQLLRYFRWIFPLMLLVSLGEFAGGIALLAGRSYRLAQIGCVLAVVNFAHGCCLPGTVAGLWGLLMLFSEEGRHHFGNNN